MSLTPKEKQVLSFLGQHLSYGLAAAITFGSAVLYTDLSHIRTLALESSHPVLIIFLLYFGLCVTFGGVGMVVGVMSLARDNERDEDIY